MYFHINYNDYSELISQTYCNIIITIIIMFKYVYIIYNLIYFISTSILITLKIIQLYTNSNLHTTFTIYISNIRVLIP